MERKKYFKINYTPSPQKDSDKTHVEGAGGNIRVTVGGQPPADFKHYQSPTEGAKIVIKDHAQSSVDPYDGILNRQFRNRRR